VTYIFGSTVINVFFRPCYFINEVNNYINDSWYRNYKKSALLKQYDKRYRIARSPVSKGLFAESVAVPEA